MSVEEAKIQIEPIRYTAERIPQQFRSGFFIEQYELPLYPETERKSINRTFQQDTTYSFFPGLEKSEVTAYDYTITGKIFPSTLALTLHELAKSPDLETVRIHSSRDENFNRFLGTGDYVFKNFQLFRRTPMYIRFLGKVTEVYDYSMTLTEFAESGETSDIFEGIAEVDEDGIGFGPETEIWTGEDPDFAEPEADIQSHPGLVLRLNSETDIFTGQ